MQDQNDTADRRLSGYVTMGRSDLAFTARAVSGDVTIGAQERDYYQLLTIYLSPEKARELAEQINAAADDADHDREVKQRVSEEIKAETDALRLSVGPAGGESE